MRTTLTLDDDVAAQINRLQRGRRASLKEIVNEALRRGLKQMNGRPQKREPFRTRTVSLGACLVGNLDDVAGVLSVIEGDPFK